MTGQVQGQGAKMSTTFLAITPLRMIQCTSSKDQNFQIPGLVSLLYLALQIFLLITFITYILCCVPSQRWGTRCQVEICHRCQEDRWDWQLRSAWLASPTSAALCPDWTSLELNTHTHNGQRATADTIADFKLCAPFSSRLSSLL